MSNECISQFQLQVRLKCQVLSFLWTVCNQTQAHDYTLVVIFYSEAHIQSTSCHHGSVNYEGINHSGAQGLHSTHFLAAWLPPPLTSELYTAGCSHHCPSFKSYSPHNQLDFAISVLKNELELVPTHLLEHQGIDKIIRTFDTYRNNNIFYKTLNFDMFLGVNSLWVSFPYIELKSGFQWNLHCDD